MRRLGRQQPALIDDRDSIADRLGLLHRVRCQKDASALLADVLDPAPQLTAGLRIKAGGGLVEQQQCGVVDDRDVQGETLLLPARELLERLVCLALEPDHAQAVGDLLTGQLDAVEPGVQPHNLADLQLELKAGRLKLHTHPGPGLVGMAPAVDVVEQDRPGLGLDQPFDGAQRARLACSVRSEQTEDLAPADLEADRVDCPPRAVSDREVAHLQDPGDPGDGDGRGAAVFGGHRLLGVGDRLGRQQQRSILVLLGDDVRTCLATPQHLHPLRHRCPHYRLCQHDQRATVSSRAVSNRDDLVCVFDCLHDMSDPVGASAHVHAVARPRRHVDDRRAVRQRPGRGEPEPGGGAVSTAPRQ